MPKLNQYSFTASVTKNYRCRTRPTLMPFEAQFPRLNIKGCLKFDFRTCWEDRWHNSHYSLAVVGKIMAPRDVHTLIPRNCEFFTPCGKRGFADAIKGIDPKIRRLSWIIQISPVWSHESFNSENLSWFWSEWKMWRQKRGQRDERLLPLMMEDRGHEPRDKSILPKTAKARKQILP